MKQKVSETFSYKVKTEAAESITGRKKSDACLLGFIMISECKEDGSLRFVTESEGCRELFLRLISHACGNDSAVCETVLRSRGRAPRYVMDIASKADIDALSDRLGFDIASRAKLFAAADRLSEKNFGSCIAGLFMACGSIASPDKEYHLEFAPKGDDVCCWIQKALEERIGISMKQTSRAGEHLLYLKGSEGIEDMLTLIGAPMSSLEIMNVKVYKNIRNRANRATNCDTANCERQNRSAARQIRAIKVIEASEGGLSRLSEELMEVAKKRLMYPEYNLTELSKEFEPPLSKSGINHRLRKIEEIAEDIQKQ